MTGGLCGVGTGALAALERYWNSDASTEKAELTLSRLRVRVMSLSIACRAVVRCSNLLYKVIGQKEILSSGKVM